MIPAQIIKGNALDLPLDDASVDLVVTSPPYFGLRSYTDGGGHYDGQIGDEETPTDYLNALIAATSEMVRVLKSSGSIWINLGDKYSRGSRPRAQPDQFRDGDDITYDDPRYVMDQSPENSGIAGKSLMGLPWRYAIRCIDDLGLILRAEVIWSKKNGLPESVTDRVRRSHEVWFHFVTQPRYFSAVDEIREPQVWAEHHNKYSGRGYNNRRSATGGVSDNYVNARDEWNGCNPLGKLPGSVWSIATQPLIVPEELGVDHFAAFPIEWPKRIIKGWSPSGICMECGEGRRPISEVVSTGVEVKRARRHIPGYDDPAGIGRRNVRYNITGYECACPEPTSQTIPATVLDPFGGTGTTALAAKVLGRTGISVDMSTDYCRLAEWRVNDPGQIAAAMEMPKPAKQVDGQMAMFD